jgi:hypothetical protein
VRELAYSSSASYRGASGILKIEGGSLVFVNRSGIISQSDYVVQSIPIRAIRSMTAQEGKMSFLGVRSHALVVMVDTSKMPGIPRHEFYVDAPGQWINAIQDEMRREAGRVDQSAQPSYVKEVVREIVKYPCPYCNGLIEVTSSRCPFCGAPQKK